MPGRYGRGNFPPWRMRVVFVQLLQERSKLRREAQFPGWLLAVVPTGDRPFKGIHLSSYPLGAGRQFFVVVCSLESSLLIL